MAQLLREVGIIGMFPHGDGDVLDPTFRRSLAVIRYNEPSASRGNVCHYKYAFAHDIQKSAVKR
jgi:hypothetical protein